MNLIEEQHITIIPFGEYALLLTWSNSTDFQAITTIHQLARHLKRDYSHMIEDIIPAANSLTLVVKSQKFLTQLHDALINLKEIDQEEYAGSLYEVPTTYFTSYDSETLEQLQIHQVTASDLIAIHADKIYGVYFMGFLPGFGYMGPIDTKLQWPRKKTPAVRVAPGSVAIADRFTAIYPQQSPGGWHIIGHTAIKLFDQTTGPILRPGDKVRFIPI